jgi:BlaI family transcriptional regulator, penicillinase repressor
LHALHGSMDEQSIGALTPLQAAILDIVWRKGRVTAEDLRFTLQPRHSLKDSTVRTLLRRLEARGYVGHDVRGGVFVYYSTMTRQVLSARETRRLIHLLYGGSTKRFVADLVVEGVLTAPTAQDGKPRGRV